MVRPWFYTKACVRTAAPRRGAQAGLRHVTRGGRGAVTVPTGVGGAGVSCVTRAQGIAGVAQADASLGQMPQSHC